MDFSISDVMAALALILSVYTLYQTSKYRSGDHLISAAKERAELNQLLERLKEPTKTLKNRWQAALSARGMLHSGLSKIKIAISDDLELKLGKVEFEFRELEELEGPFSRSKAEETLKKLVALRASADGIASALESEEAEIKQHLLPAQFSPTITAFKPPTHS